MNQLTRMNFVEHNYLLALFEVDACIPLESATILFPNRLFSDLFRISTFWNRVLILSPFWLPKYLCFLNPFLSLVFGFVRLKDLLILFDFLSEPSNSVFCLETFTRLWLWPVLFAIFGCVSFVYSFLMILLFLYLKFPKVSYLVSCALNCRMMELSETRYSFCTKSTSGTASELCRFDLLILT